MNFFYLVIILVLSAVIYFMARPLIKGAVYFPTRNEAIKIMLDLSDIKKGDRLVDLGSGDGRILIAFAEKGIEAYGYEVNPFLVWRSRRAINRAGFKNKAFVYWKSFWSADLTSFDIVVIYGFPNIMESLESKLKKELKSNTRVVSNRYKFPHWPIITRINDVYLYKA